MSDALRGGTTDQDARDAALLSAQTAGTADAAGANAGGNLSLEEVLAENERLKNAQAQALAEKTRHEATVRENEALKARLSAPPIATTTGALDPRSAQQAAFVSRLQQHAIVAQADPGSDSALVVGLYEQNQFLAQKLNQLSGLIGTPAEQQTQVRDLQNEYAQRGETISATTAQELLKSRQMAASAEQVSAREREQAAAEDARARGVVSTRTVGVPRSEVEPKQMTMADFEAKTANMTPSEARAFDAQLAKNGTVVLPE